MAHTVGTLPTGSRITDYISLGVIAKFFPLENVHETLHQTKRASRRERDLPAHVVVYYVIASGALHALVLSGGVALPAGGSAVAAGSVGHRQGGGQIGDFASPQPAGGRTAEEVVRDRRDPDRRKMDAGSLVSTMAAGEPGRQHLGCGGHRGERPSLRSARGQSGIECLPQDSLRGLAGKWHARSVGGASGSLCNGRDDAGACRGTRPEKRHAVPGRPVFPRL